ncbi:hypothetical protein [Catellatospora sp. NPDC049133]|uniref:hypothetical protein n=1 Tax=Catellatospora sp. NPDC049133 TaxID=3155499 RepID=UPI0033E4D797
MSIPWTTPVGGYLTRAERVAMYGGGMYGGMEPSAKSPNVFIYSDPSRGETYGYTFDGWDPDEEVFLYTGEGPEGDQQMTSGNLALLDHRRAGRVVRLFVADGVTTGTTKNHRYLGEFEIDPELPYTIERAPGQNNGPMRNVFVFRLLPAGDYLDRAADRSAVVDAPGGATVREVALEATNLTTVAVPATPPTIAQKREAELVARFKAWMGPNHIFTRHEIVPPGHFKALYTDLYERTANELYEAKASATREAIRMAVGQLLDYRRHIKVDNLRLVILVPKRPSADLLDFIRSVGAECCYEIPDGTFVRWAG